MTRRKRILAIMAVNIVLTLGLVGLLELGMRACLRFPSLTRALPPSLRYIPLDIYDRIDRTTIHDFAAWDDLLTYRIEPGSQHRWRAREFDVSLSGNSAGLRDDEQSLHAPVLIALGDSFTMGVGVRQVETYPELLGNELGCRALNGGIESYGTARELLLLNRLDQSRLRYLVVQYCENDYQENRVFAGNGHALPTLSREAYADVVSRFRAQTRDFPGRFLLTAFQSANRRRRILARPQRRYTALELEIFHAVQAALMLDILNRLPQLAPNCQLLLFSLVDTHATEYLRPSWEARGLTFDSALFAALLRQLIAEREYAPCLEKACIVEPGHMLSRDDRFILDGHLRASGHRKLAEALAAALREDAPAASPSLLSSRAERDHLLGCGPLPDAAFAASVTAEQPEMRVARGESVVTVRLRVRNDSPHWWPAVVLDRRDRYGLSVAPHLLDGAGRPVEDLYAAAATELRLPVGPGETVDVAIPVDVRSVPHGDSWLEYDMLQQHYCWFAERGGKAARIHLIRP